MPLSEKFAHLSDNLGDADRTVKNGCDGRQRDGLRARRDQNRRNAPDEAENAGIVGEAGDGFEYDDGGQLAGGEGLAGVVGGFHAERVEGGFAEFGADGSAERPIAGDDEDDWHPDGGV